MSKNYPFFDFNLPETIPYADRPLAANTPISQISPEEFKNKFGCQYSETIWGSQKAVTEFKQNYNPKRPNTPEEAKLLEFFNNPERGLVVCDMTSIESKSSTARLGYTLFSSKPIQCKTILGIYAGEWTEPKVYASGENDCYCYVDPHGLDNQFISSKAIGGIVRFMPHLPFDIDAHERQVLKNIQSHPRAAGCSEETLKQLIRTLREPNFDDMLNTDVKFHSSKGRKNIAVANAAIHSDLFFGLRVNVVTAARDIPAFVPVGFSYGPKFWIASRTFPLFLTKNGRHIINEKEYVWIKGRPMYEGISRPKKIPLTELEGALPMPFSPSLASSSSSMAGTPAISTSAVSSFNETRHSIWGEAAATRQRKPKIVEGLSESSETQTSSIVKPKNLG